MCSWVVSLLRESMSASGLGAVKHNLERENACAISSWGRQLTMVVKIQCLVLDISLVGSTRRIDAELEID